MHSQFEPLEPTDSQPLQRHDEIARTTGEMVTSAGTSSDQEPTSVLEPLLEHYLDRLCVPLENEMSLQARLEMRAEIRGHLISLAAAFEELGSAPAVALYEALQQFGAAETIGASFMKQHRAPLGLEPTISLHLLTGAVATGLASIGLNRIANEAMVALGMQISHGEPFDLVLALALGMTAGGLLWRRRKSTLDAALSTGGLYAAAAAVLSVAVVTMMAYTHSFGVYQPQKLALTYAEVVGIYSLFGAVTGVCGSLITRGLRRLLTRTNVSA